MPKAPTFQMSADARLLYQAIKLTPVGETIAYSALSDVISSPVDGSTAALRTALRRCLRDDDMVFGVIPRVGLKRLTDAEIVNTGPSVQAKLRRAARRGVEVLTKVSDFDALPNAAKLAHSAHLSVMASIAHIATGGAVEKIEAAVTQKGGRELPIAETMRLFAKV